MTHTYTISGATCGGCLNTIKTILSKLPEVESLETNLNPPVATIKLNKHVSLDYFNQALVDAGKGKYTLSNEQMLGKDLFQNSTNSAI